MGIKLLSELFNQCIQNYIDFKCEVNHWSFSFHQFRKLVITDISISIQISFFQYLIKIFFTELFSQFTQTFSKFFLWDKSIVIFIKKFKHLLEISCLISFPLINLTKIRIIVPGNECEKLVKLNCPRII